MHQWQLRAISLCINTKPLARTLPFFLSLQDPEKLSTVSMATSLFLMASAEPTVPEYSTNRYECTEEAKPDNPRSSRARKTSKSAATAQKKQPQRGMGVAQLERLRYEEWKQMTGINHLQSMSFPGHFRYQIPFQFPEQPPAPPSSPVHPGSVPRLGGGAVHGFSGGGGFRVVDPYRNGGAVGTLPEASRELSSMPNMDCVFDRCDVCFKVMTQCWWFILHT